MIYRQMRLLDYERAEHPPCDSFYVDHITDAAWSIYNEGRRFSARFGVRAWLRFLFEFPLGQLDHETWRAPFERPLYVLTPWEYSVECRCDEDADPDLFEVIEVER